MSIFSWRRFDRVMNKFNREFDHTLNRVVAPSQKPSTTGKPLIDVVIKELTTLPKKREK